MIKYDEPRHLSQFELEMFEFWQLDFTSAAPQYELSSFVTLATYWIPDFPDIKGFSGYPQILHQYLPIVPHLHDLAVSI